MSECCKLAQMYKTRHDWMGNKIQSNLGGVRGVMVIVIGNGHGDPSSNPGWDWLHFT